MKPGIKFLITLIPLLVGMIALLFTHNEWIISGIVVLVIIATFWLEYHKNEIWWLLIGIGVGVILEIGGDLIWKLQYWSEGSIMGLPLWLFLWWGYAFVLIRRAGNFVVKEEKK